MLLKSLFFILYMIDFKTVWQDLQEKDSFQTFCKERGDYYLAHGFLQLTPQGTPSKPWQIGLYSPEKDDLALFTAPDFQLHHDKAFKDGGIIQQLTFSDSFLSTESVYERIQTFLSQEYSHEAVQTTLLILQVIDQTPVYNCTVVTQSFKMITLHFDVFSGEILHKNISSVLDLKATD